MERRIIRQWSSRDGHVTLYDIVIVSTPSTCRQWKYEQAEMLAKKDAEEQASLEELKVQARNELAEWYARHEEQLNQTKTLNR